MACRGIMLKHRLDVVSLASIKAAAERIKHSCYNTPIMTSSYLDSATNKTLYFKCELLQKTGAFKLRGATNAVKLIKEYQGDGKDPVTVTHSSGNHGIALAHASKAHNLRCVVVVPKNSPQSKQDAVLGFAAEIVRSEASSEGRVNTCQRILEEIGDHAEYVPSADHPFISAGQGTMALEMLEKVPHLDAIVIPVGGGGMLSGMAVAAKAVKPTIKIFAAEPLLANDTAKSFTTGERVLVSGDLSKTVADGLRMGVGELSWPIIQKHVDGVITLSEEEIIDTMVLLWKRMKLTVEASAAIAYAAVSKESHGLLKDCQHVGVVLCGGNVDLENLPWLKK